MLQKIVFDAHNSLFDVLIDLDEDVLNIGLAHLLKKIV